MVKIPTKGIPEVLIGDNLSTYIYEQHYQREIATGTIDGTGTQEFSTTHKMEAVIGDASEIDAWTGSPLPQYVDASGNYGRRDVFIETLKSGKFSPLNTTTYPVTIIPGATGSFTVSGSLPASVAGSLVVSYSASLREVTDLVTTLDVSGGGRSNNYVVVQGGKRIKYSSVQEQRTVSIGALSIDNTWVKYLNGTDVTTSITSDVSGSDSVNISTGATTRTYPKTVVCRQDDPATGNQVIEAFFNVDQVSNDTSRPSEGQATETAVFECQPQDYTRIETKYQQG